MNVINASSAPMLNSAGSDTTKANSSFRIPFAAYENTKKNDKEDYVAIFSPSRIAMP